MASSLLFCSARRCLIALHLAARSHRLVEHARIWFIPTLSFAVDTATMHSPRPAWYAGRSCVELVLIVPWIYIWMFISFFCLGGGWI